MFSARASSNSREGACRSCKGGCRTPANVPILAVPAATPDAGLSPHDSGSPTAPSSPRPNSKAQGVPQPATCTTNRRSRLCRSQTAFSSQRMQANGVRAQTVQGRQHAGCAHGQPTNSLVIWALGNHHGPQPLLVQLDSMHRQVCSRADC